MVAATVKGGDKLLATVSKMRDRVMPAASAALYQKAEQIMTAAKSICPVATGRLRASGYVEQPQGTGDKINVRMGFGTSYALAVHENLSAHHAHGQAKFLELAFYEKGAGLAAWMKAQILRNLENGVATFAASMPTSAAEGEMQRLHAIANRMNRSIDRRRARDAYRNTEQSKANRAIISKVRRSTRKTRGA